jgi:hypothetical protein
VRVRERAGEDQGKRRGEKIVVWALLLHLTTKH